MQNKKLEKILVKAGIGTVFSIMLGIVYKQGEKVNEVVDNKYEKEHGVSKSNKLW